MVEPYPSEKWWTESQLGWWHSQYDGKNKSHVPNHQPDIVTVEISHRFAPLFTTALDITCKLLQAKDGRWSKEKATEGHRLQRGQDLLVGRQPRLGMVGGWCRLPMIVFRWCSLESGFLLLNFINFHAQNGPNVGWNIWPFWSCESGNLQTLVNIRVLPWKRLVGTPTSYQDSLKFRNFWIRQVSGSNS